MLVLSRRIGEMLMIGEEVEIILLSINGQQARLGITAPKSIEVHREEVYHRIKATKTKKVQRAYHTKEPANESFSA